jgi:hypothetical protein
MESTQIGLLFFIGQKSDQWILKLMNHLASFFGAKTLSTVTFSLTTLCTTIKKRVTQPKSLLSMLSVVMLNVIMLCVKAPIHHLQIFWLKTFLFY